jgi:hypothetical protein
VNVIVDLIAGLGAVCAGLPDRRTEPGGGGQYSMADTRPLGVLSLFFMGSPSFLAHQRALPQGRSTCQTLFGMTAIPSDNYIRLMLDGASPAAFDPLLCERSSKPDHWHASSAWVGGC